MIIHVEMAQSGSLLIYLRGGERTGPEPREKRACEKHPRKVGTDEIYATCKMYVMARRTRNFSQNA